MDIASRITATINQSFRLVIQTIVNGVKSVVTAIGRMFRAVGNLIGKLHSAIATVIQIIINISSVVFVIFIPIALFLDPLNWSRFLEEYVSSTALFWVRMVTGLLFTCIVFLLFSSLWETFKATKNASKESEDTSQQGIVRSVSNFVSWLVIAFVFVYFFVFRLRIFGIRPETLPLPSWLVDLLASA